MNEFSTWQPAAGAAHASGRFFSAAFGGRSVERFLCQPPLWFFGSLLLLDGLTLVGFYFVGPGNTGSAGCYACSFCPGTPGRGVAYALIGRKPTGPAQEASYAP